MRIQQLKRYIKKKCCFCGNSDLNVLDCHRIDPGSRYTDWGTLIVCSNCHRKVHSSEIQDIKKYKSTGGDVICYTENGEEKWASA